MRDRTSLRARLVRATLDSAAIRMLGMGFAFLVGVQLARYLGPHGFGIYGTVMAITTLLVVPAQLGLPQLITREVSTGMARQDPAGTKGVMIGYTSLVVAASLLVAGLSCTAVLGWPDLDPQLRQALYWGMACIPLLTLLNLAVGTLRGLHRVVAAQSFDALIRPIAYAGLLALAASASGHLSATTALALQVLAVLSTLAFCIWHVLRCVPRLTLAATHVSIGRRMPAGAAPMLGTELLRVLDGQYAILLLGMVASLSDVGLFRVALAVTGFVGLPSTLINLVIMSFVAQLHAEGDHRRLQLIAAGAAVAMSCAIGSIVLVLFFWGEAFIGLVFGKAFVPAWAPLLLMSAAYVVNALFGSAATILNMAGGERTVMLVHIVGPAVGIVVTLLLYGRLGLLAPALAMFVAECIKGGWLAYAARRSLGIDVTLLAAGALFARVGKPGAPVSR